MELCDIKTVVYYILLGEFLKRVNWFVFEILIFYFVFWILYRFLPIKTANILLGIIIVVAIGIGFHNRIANFWYASSSCVFLGVLYAQNEKELNLFLNEQYYLKNAFLLSGCAACILLFLGLGNDSTVGNPVAKNMAALFFCIWTLSVLQKIRVKFGILRWLGEVSYEIFLLHFVWLRVLKMFITSAWGYVLAVTIATLISANILRMPIRKVERLIRRRLQ